MAAMVPPSHWTPEDDLLLKNSVEAGASLESLAKGAVQFSRRFTIQELQERWYSLLYNPIVAQEASHLMTEIELSSFHLSNERPSKQESAKETTSTSMKRKAETIRKSYYAMRKRICNESFDMIDIDLLCGLDNSNFGDGNLSTADCLIGNPVPNNLGIQLGGKNVSQNLQYPHNQSEVPGFGPSNQLPFCNSFAVDGFQNDGNECLDVAGSSFDGIACCSSLPQMSTWSTSTHNLHTGDTLMLPESGDANVEGALPPSMSDYLAELSNTLFNCTIDDELFFADTNENDIMNKSYLDSWNLLLLDSTNQNDFPTTGLGEDAVAAAADMHINGASGAHSWGPSDMALYHCDEKKLPEAQLMSPVPTFRHLGPEYRNGVICCTLNTEDPDIPSNDDVFLLNGSSRSHGPSNLAPSSSARKSNGGSVM